MTLLVERLRARRRRYRFGITLKTTLEQDHRNVSHSLSGSLWTIRRVPLVPSRPSNL